MIIGLCGYPTVGKSAVADILVRDHGYDILETKEILRDITSLITRCPSHLMKETGFKNLPYQRRTQREIMGEIGKTLEELFGADYLLRRALHREATAGRKLVIDGLRRDQALFFDGIVLEVVSDRVSGASYDFDEYNKTKIDYTLNNSGTISDLEAEIKKMMVDLTV
jgi:dephospho-CoA kinase